jgi:hypothetical protein
VANFHLTKGRVRVWVGRNGGWEQGKETKIKNKNTINNIHFSQTTTENFL